MNRFTQVFSDFRFAFRTLRKRPSFTLAGVLTLALGLTSATLAFSLTYDVLLRRLPYPSPGQLVRVQEDPGPKNRDGRACPKNLVDWIARSPRSIEGLSTYQSGTKVVFTGQEPLRASYLNVSKDFLETLGAHTLLGRLFSLAEYSSPDPRNPAVSNLVLLSHTFWMDYLGGRPGVIGQQIQVDGQVATVVGVLAREVALSIFGRELEEPQIVHPLDLAALAQRYRRRGVHALQVIGRLRPGTTSLQATSELNGIATQVAAETADPEADVNIVLVPLLELLVADSRNVLLLVAGATGLIFLIACTNVGSLFLIRTRRRILEIGIRRALGASHSRIGSLILTEAVVIVGISGTLSLVLAGILYNPLIVLARQHLPRLNAESVHWQVWWFAAGSSLVTLLLIGLLSVGGAVRKQIRECLSVNTSGSGSRVLGSRLVVIGQLMLCVVLLVGAGLVSRTLSKLAEVDTGFDAENLIVVRVAFTRDLYRDATRKSDRIDSFLQDLKQLPGVDWAGYGNAPLEGGRTATGFYKEGSEERLGTAYNPVGADYFESLGVPILRGRNFTGNETRGSPARVIVNESFARRYFPGEEVVGKRIRDTLGEWITIIGLCADVRFLGLMQEPGPAMFQHHRQAAVTHTSFFIKSEPSPGRLIPMIEEALRGKDSSSAVYRVESIQDVINRAMGVRPLLARVFSLFALAALALAMVGLYGVLASWVQQRRQEIGIRMALGASRLDIGQLVVQQAFMTVLAGILLGSGIALILTRYLESFLFGVEPTDPVSFLGAALALVLASTGGILSPLIRALRTNPLSSVGRAL